MNDALDRCVSVEIMTCDAGVAGIQQRRLLGRSYGYIFLAFIDVSVVDFFRFVFLPMICRPVSVVLWPSLPCVLALTLTEQPC